MGRYLAISGLIPVIVVWGGGFVAGGMALEPMNPSQIMTIRSFLGMVILESISLPGMKVLKKGEIRAGTLMGCALFVGLVLQTIGLQYTMPSKNAFLTVTDVVVVLFLTFLIYRRRVGLNGIVGAVMAVVGVRIPFLNGDFFLETGGALTLLGVVGSAFQILPIGEFAAKYQVKVLSCVQMTAAFVLSALLLVGMGGISVHAFKEGRPSILYLGLIGMAPTYLLQTSYQQYVSETKVAIIPSVESVFGILFSVILLKELITPRVIAGRVITPVVVLLFSYSGGENMKRGAARE